MTFSQRWQQGKLNRRFLKACRSGTLTEVENLLAAGADIHAKGFLGFGAIHAATQRKNFAVAQFLIEKKADVNEFSDSGLTPLHLAAMNDQISAVQWLLDHGADMNALSGNGHTALTYAARAEHPAIVKFLQERAAKGPAASAVVHHASVTAGWTLSAPDKVVFVEDEPAIGYRQTSIFNFNAQKRMYTNISRNLENGVESQTVRFFDEFPDKGILENAYDELVRQGGKADKNVIYGPVIHKS